MSRIETITEEITPDELPPRLRDRFKPGTQVRLTVVGEAKDTSFTPEEIEARKNDLLKYWGAFSHLGTTTEEAVARIRALRDEWD